MSNLNNIKNLVYLFFIFVFLFSCSKANEKVKENDNTPIISPTALATGSQGSWLLECIGSYSCEPTTDPFGDNNSCTLGSEPGQHPGNIICSCSSCLM